MTLNPWLRIPVLFLIVLAILAAAYLSWRYLRQQVTMDQRIEELSQRLRPGIEDVLAAPRPFIITVDKSVEEVVLYDANWQTLRRWPMTGTIGTAGPKRREGDNQIPEGVYPITALNPQSRFYLSLRLGYPNTIDSQFNDTPGSDIYMHGGSATIGCVPIGDEAIEALFLIVALAGRDQFTVCLYSSADLDSPLDAAYEQSIRKSLDEVLAGGLPDWPGAWNGS